MLWIYLTCVICFHIHQSRALITSENDCFNRFIDPIDMKNCNITSLHPNHFTDHSRITTLDMSDNPDFDFPSNGTAFLYHDRLRYYRCESCGITTIYEQTFAGLPQLKLLNLRSNHIKVIPAEAFTHNRLQFLIVANNQIETFNEQHKLDSMQHLLQLDASENQGFQLNKLSIALSNFEYIVCSECKISIVQEQWFAQITRLRKVILENNDIRVIPRNCFSGNNRLTYLNLNYNPLQRFGFANERIETLSCIGCNLTHLDDDSFKHLPGLRVLELQNNSIKSVDPQTYMSNSWLHSLYLDNNELTSFPIEILKLTPALKVLCLDNNFLQSNKNISVLSNLYKALEFRDNCAAGLNQLHHFEHFLPSTNLVGKSLYEKDLPQCNELVNISNRQVVFIHPLAYNNCHSLNTLEMNGNSNFSFYRNHPLLYSKSLEVYSCTHCGIRAIFEDTFQHLPQLRKLLLQHNYLLKLTSVDLFTLNSQLSIIELDYNHLRQLSVNLLESHKNVSTLNFNHNSMLSFSSEASFLVQQIATNFQAAYCAIDHITELSFRAMPSLLEIDVSNNPITSIDPGAFERNRQLRILKLSNTHLRVLPVASIAPLGHLKVLCLDSIQRYVIGDPLYSGNNAKLRDLIMTKKLYCNGRELFFASQLAQERSQMAPEKPQLARYRQPILRSSGSISDGSIVTTAMLSVFISLRFKFL
ncbi:leucine-rich repeat-containing G-protein coupled receptor 5-like [Topomyia yanbarensis]|uniref:leucine-rich repeat-containing G-protein coupled receptor 5-like n=1 Tax=Topomyia yanbarensis TaxID=2498891 RepID=UPI00273BDD33|nr:leucine-rich repeat-containing G-protein coupled receptor 5-like [Topomyia yanbarensis]